MFQEGQVSVWEDEQRDLFRSNSCQNFQYTSRPFDFRLVYINRQNLGL